MEVTKLYDIKYPIIQAGMVWVSGAKLAAASANAGILGVIGAGSMKPPLLEAHIRKAQSLAPNKSLAVNIPLLYEGASEQIELALKLGVKHFITSAGSPKKFTSLIKDKGCSVTHVVSNPMLAQKCETAGVDVIIAEGFEAGGHNGRDELTTMVLVPQVKDAVNIPVIAAGGIMDHRGIRAALALGADGVQLGTRFLATQESSAHQRFKDYVLKAQFNSTKLVMKSHVPVRLLDNDFAKQVAQLESRCASQDELIELLGKGRAKKGMLEGNLEEGELEVGQGVSLIKDLPTVKDLISELSKAFQG